MGQCLVKEENERIAGLALKFERNVLLFERFVLTQPPVLIYIVGIELQNPK